MFNKHKASVYLNYIRRNILHIALIKKARFGFGEWKFE